MSLTNLHSKSALLCCQCHQVFMHIFKSAIPIFKACKCHLLIADFKWKEKTNSFREGRLLDFKDAKKYSTSRGKSSQIVKQTNGKIKQDATFELCLLLLKSPLVLTRLPCQQKETSCEMNGWRHVCVSTGCILGAGPDLWEVSARLLQSWPGKTKACANMHDDIMRYWSCRQKIISSDFAVREI